ncbi:MAG TPA: class I SAM-dependent methyltransferase [Alphaproteobacteria bacterium]
MSIIAILLIIIALAGYGFKEYYQIKLQTAPTSSPKDVADQIALLLYNYNPEEGGNLIDLGSGWGGFVLDMARRLPNWQIDGIEASPTPWVVANCRSISKSISNYRFFIGRMEDHSLKNYDVIYLNQTPRNLQLMLPRLLRALQNDSLILSYQNPLPRLPNPDILNTNGGHRIYMYRGIEALDVMNNEPSPPRLNPIAEPINEVEEPVIPEAMDENSLEQTPADQAQLPLNQTD